MKFYDVGQGASALIELPDGDTVLVDAGGQGDLAAWVSADLDGRPLSLVWITHPQADHLSQMMAILEQVEVLAYVDNGLDGGIPSRRDPRGMGAGMRDAAAAHGARTAIVTPEHPTISLPGEGSALRLNPVVPAAWPSL